MKLRMWLAAVLIGIYSNAAEWPDVMATEQKESRILILDGNRNWSDPAAVKWEWHPADSPEIPELRRDWFANPDEVKAVNGNTALLITAGEGAALIRIADKKALFYVQVGGNPHSAELLPDGNLVTASSTGNYLRIFAIPSDGTGTPETIPFEQIPMENAHGAVWDPEAQLLYASGLYGIAAFAYNADKTHPMLTRVADYPVLADRKEYHGHDLYRLPQSRKLVLTGSRDVRIFDPATGRYEMVAAVPDIKSTSRHRPDAPLLVALPQEQWWTDTASLLEGDRLTPFATMPGARFYKLRWMPNGETVPGKPDSCPADAVGAASVTPR